MANLLLPSPALPLENTSSAASSLHKHKEMLELNSINGQLPAHYTKEQKRLVCSALYQQTLRQAIEDMEGYAKDHGLVDGEDPIPESVYMRPRLWNWLAFVKFCFDNSVNQNPYKVPKGVYMFCLFLLATAIVIKVWVVKQVSEHVEPCQFTVSVDRSGMDTLTGALSVLVRKVPCNPRADVSRTWDTMASALPIVVTLMLFLFPPLLSNWEPSKDRIKTKENILNAQIERFNELSGA